MKREELRQIGIKDRTGKEIVVGDIFEYENLYIVTYDPEEDNFKIQEYENLVEYGVEQEPYYELIEEYNIDELELFNDQIKGNIYVDKVELQNKLHSYLQEYFNYIINN